MNFFRVNFELCTKISALWNLRDTSPGRALFHSFLMLLLCPLFVAAILVWSEKEPFRRVIDEIYKTTGGIRVSSDSCSLANSGKEQAHFSFHLFRTPSRFDFFASEKLLPKSWPARENAGAAGTPRNFFFWAGRSSPGYTLVRLPSRLLWLFFASDAGTNPVDSGSMALSGQLVQPHLYSAEGLLKEIREKGFAPLDSGNAAPKETEEGRVLSVAAPGKTVPADAESLIIPPRMLLHVLLSLIGGSLFVGFFVQIFFQFLAGAAFFSLAQKIRFRTFPVKLSFGKIFSLTLYSMFPALILASFFEMLQLEFLSFQTVFFIVFFIYHFQAFNFVMRRLNPPPDSEEPHGGDL